MASWPFPIGRIADFQILSVGKGKDLSSLSLINHQPLSQSLATDSKREI